MTAGQVHSRIALQWPGDFAPVPPCPPLPCLCATLMRCEAEDNAVARRKRRREIRSTTARRLGYVVQHAELL